MRAVSLMKLEGRSRSLEDALLEHCLSYLEEASNVSTLDVVDVVPFPAMSHGLLVDVAHDLVA